MRQNATELVLTKEAIADTGLPVDSKLHIVHAEAFFSDMPISGLVAIPCPADIDIATEIEALKQDSYEVNSDEEYAAAGEKLILVAKVAKKAEAFFKPMTSLANRFHKTLTGKTKVHVDAAGKIRLAIEKGRSEYKTRRAEEAAKIQAAAVAQIENREETLQEKLETALEQGDMAEARKIQAQMNESASLKSSASMAIMPELPKTKGIIDREEFNWTVTDMREVLQAVLDKKIPIEAVTMQSTVVNDHVRAHKLNLGWPGIKVNRSEETTVRTK